MCGNVNMSSLLIILLSITHSIALAPGQSEQMLYLRDLLHYRDADRDLTFREVSHPQFKGFAIKPDYQPIDYDPGAAYWVHFVVNLPEGKHYLLEIFDQTIDSIQVYIIAPSGIEKQVTLGDAYPFAKKPFKHKNFEISLEESGSYEFYIRFASYHFADIRMAIRSIDHFIYYALNEYFVYGIFYGMIAIISLYNLLIFSAIKERKYVYYTFYILSVGFYAMSVDGIAYQFLWPSHPGWNQIAYGVALFSVIFWSILFSKRFLNLKVKAPGIDQLLNVILGLRIAIFGVALFFNPNLFQHRSLELIPLSVIFYGSIVVFFRGYKPARFFVVAYGFLFLGFILKALLMLSNSPANAFSYYTLHVCFVFEMLFLSFALSDRVRILKSLRDKALKRTIVQHEENMKLKDKVNRELEDKVRERTLELDDKNRLLEQTNSKLIQQSHEINQINSMLDLDNWKLKNNIKEVLEDRFINKYMSYEEFLKVFPDDLACLRYLNNLKWQDGFQCKKCHNNKYFKGAKKFDRRCTKCGYNESLTAYTAFHGLKFPIQKAFYIAYIVTNTKADLTLDQLSEILGLRRNTIWNFKNKVKSALANHHPPGDEALNHWRSIFTATGPATDDNKVSV